MSFQPEKCRILRVHRKGSPVLFDYSLKYHILKCEKSTKYLGVEMSRDITWKLHIDRTVKKGNSTLSFLLQNLRVSNEEVKSAAYRCIAGPTLEFCSTLWNPYKKTRSTSWRWSRGEPLDIQQTDVTLQVVGSSTMGITGVQSNKGPVYHDVQNFQ